jgi:hypothetical protein
MTSWTSPRTWTTSELATASMLNTHVRDNELHLKEQVTSALIKTLTVGFGDASGIVLPTGLKGFLPIPFDGTILGWTLLGDQVGSLVIDVWKDTYGNFPPTVADTIAGSEKPTLTAQQKNQDNTLTTWTTAITAGDVLAFNVDSCSTIKQATLTLLIQASYS